MGGTVVQLVPALEQGGVETVVCDLNRELVRAGWRSVVASRGGRLVKRVLADGGEHVALDLKSKDPLTAPVRAWRLRRTLRETAPSLVCAHSRVPAWLFVLARKLDASLSSLPFVTYAHGANSVSAYSAVMTKGDRVIVPSRFLEDFLVANYGTAGKDSQDGQDARDGQDKKDALDKKDAQDAGGLRSKIRVIRPAVDFSRFDPGRVDAGVADGLRREWGLRAGDRVVMSVGRLTPLKGFDHLIRDLAGQLDVAPDGGWGDVLRSPEARLVIVGGADRRHLAYEAELKALAASLGVAGRVVFAGQRSRIPECLSLADVVVSGNMTKPESFGLSVAEALAMNRPVRLLRRFGGAAEILDEVAAAKRPTLRDGVRALCEPGVMSRKTQSVYAELVG